MVMALFSFIKNELTEAKYIRSPSDTVGRSDSSIAESFYDHLLMLQQMRFENPAWAKRYAQDTLRYMDFTNVRSGATDLHNLAAILNNPGKFSDKMGADFSNIRFDELGFKRYLRNIVNNHYDASQDRSFLMNMQRNLGISNSVISAMRRVAADYGHSTPGERSSIAMRMSNSMRHDNRFRSDMFAPYAAAMKSRDVVPQEKPGMSLAAKTALATIAGAVAGYQFGKWISK